MTARQDEDILSAYIDGELVPAAMEEIEETIEKENSARAYIIDSVKTAARLRASMNRTLEEQVPDRLLAALDSRSDRQHRQRPIMSAFVRLAAAILILISGFLVGKVISTGDDKQLPALVANLPAPYRQVVDEALEYNLSGMPRQQQLSQNSITVTVTPVRTYRNSDGRYYREYRLEISGGNQPVRINGLAYRADPGRWTTKAIFF